MGPGVKALCMVAHPDDCVIFALSFIHHNPQWHWQIAYLTYTARDRRGRELADFWNGRNIPVQFLEFQDDWRDLEAGVISFDTESAADQIETLCQDHDVVLTHDAAGDYGHLHHRFVHDSVQHNNVIYFAGYQQGNLTYCVDDPGYNQTNLPGHFDVVQGFHGHSHRNEYQVPEHLLAQVAIGNT